MLIDAMLILLIGTVTVLLPLSKAYRSRLRRRLMKQAEATIPREQSMALETRVTRQTLATGGAILVAGLVVLALDWVWDVDGANFILVTFLAGAAGHALADILWPGAPGTGPRTARATTPTVAHYVPPHVQVWATVLVCFGVLAGAGTLLLSRSDSFDRDTILSSSVPALAAGLMVVFGAVVAVVRGGTWSEFRHVRDALWDGVAPQARRQEVDA